MNDDLPPLYYGRIWVAECLGDLERNEYLISSSCSKMPLGNLPIFSYPQFKILQTEKSGAVWGFSDMLCERSPGHAGVCSRLKIFWLPCSSFIFLASFLFVFFFLHLLKYTFVGLLILLTWKFEHGSEKWMIKFIST